MISCFGQSITILWQTNRPAVRLTVDGNTNLVANGVPFLSASPNMFFLIPTTVTNSTDSTYGYGAGLICLDTNYIYFSVGTNQWKRVAGTNW